MFANLTSSVLLAHKEYLIPMGEMVLGKQSKGYGLELVEGNGSVGVPAYTAPECTLGDFGVPPIGGTFRYFFQRTRFPARISA